MARTIAKGAYFGRPRRAANLFGIPTLDFSREQIGAELARQRNASAARQNDCTLNTGTHSR
jgi:hypothetical protein